MNKKFKNFIISRNQKGFVFWFFKLLLDTHFKKQWICWQLFKLQKYKFYRNFIEPRIEKFSETYREERYG